MPKKIKINSRKSEFWGPWEDKSHVRLALGAPKGLKATFINKIYSVQVFVYETVWGVVTLLMIRRHDGREIHGWDDLYRIKNEIVDPERIAVEVYPKLSELVNTVNMRHLWVLASDIDLPFNLYTPKPEKTIIEPKMIVGPDGK